MKNEWADIDGLCTDGNVPSDPLLQGCLQNSRPDKVTKRIVVLGDSHAQQYMAALGPIAKSHGWEVVTLLKGNCRFGGESPERDADCNAFNKASAAVRPGAQARRRLHGRLADAQGGTVRNRGAAVPGRHQAVHRRRHRGGRHPRQPAVHHQHARVRPEEGPDAADCNVPLQESLAASSPLDAYRGKVARLHLMDMSDFICADGTCPAVVGNVYVYKDDNHLTKTYVQSMIPMFEKRLLAATGWK